MRYGIATVVVDEYEATHAMVESRGINRLVSGEIEREKKGNVRALDFRRLQVKSSRANFGERCTRAFLNHRQLPMLSLSHRP